MIGILSDAHGNGPAFNQAIELLRKHGVSRFIYLGDAVGYIPSVDVVAALRVLGSEVICIRGNHEVMLLNNSCDSKREEVYRLKNVRNSLKVEDRDFIQSWPTHHIESINGRRMLFVHGSPKNYTSGYVYPDADLSLFDESYNFVFMGHTHYPFIRQLGSACFVNVGSCGMPRDDGRFGACATFDPNTGDVRIFRFDITVSSMKAFLNTGPCHESVNATFDRRCETIYGEIIE
jgi:putative phosphoesterase